jgi:regulator of protease activity HflC (stomatin/prohibitin superfamily)
MKKSIFTILMAVVAIATLPSCETVPPGHRGVEVSWGGKTNMQEVYPEGLTWGFHWIFDDLIPYDVRQNTLVQKFEFNDRNNMVTPVEIALDYNLSPDKVNLLHTSVKDIETKIQKTLKSAGKEVVPQYSAVDLNISKRTEAEDRLAKILSEELPDFYVEFARVQVTDVDIPAPVAKLAEETSVQEGRNKLAEKKEAEQVALAKARVAEAQGEYDAAKLQAKTKDILSQPKMLKLMELEIEKTYAEGYLKHGNSKYGTNNVYGSGTAVFKGLK